MRARPDDWVPALDHRHLVVAAHLLGYAGLVVLLTWLTRRAAWPWRSPRS